MGVINFNGKSSKGIFHIENPPNYEMAERAYDIQSIPGRNGDLPIDLKSYKNVVRSYNISVGAEGADFASLAEQISNFLYSGAGYKKLEDSYGSNYYYLARYSDSIEIVNILQQAGRATINFDRKPQRFLKSGDVPIEIFTSGVITNPTNNDAKPLIRVNIRHGEESNGVVTIGGYSVTIKGALDYMYLDCETEDATKDGINLNPNITCSNRLFPIIHPGNNNVSYTGNITSLEIIPRWWIL